MYNYSDSKTRGLVGGYIDEIDQNLLFGTNGKGETFLYSLLEKKFTNSRKRQLQIITEKSTKQIKTGTGNKKSTETTETNDSTGKTKTNFGVI